MSKLLLLHGPAIEASRRKLQELRKKFNSDNIIVFDEKTDQQQILTNLQSQSLFEGERLVIVENPSGDFTDYTLYPIPCTLILWFDHKIDKKEWPGFEESFFPEGREVSVFPFLDLLAAKDTGSDSAAKAYLEIEKLKAGGFDIHYFLTMVFYLLRNLVVTPKTAPSFVKQKLEKQRSRFNKEKLIDLYKDILEIDFKLKSGFLEKSHAEFLLVQKFTDAV